MIFTLFQAAVIAKNLCKVDDLEYTQLVLSASFHLKPFRTGEKVFLLRNFFRVKTRQNCHVRNYIQFMAETKLQLFLLTTSLKTFK